MKCGAQFGTVKRYKMLERDYKFYLSSENSTCKLYVAEKRVLHYDLISGTPEHYGIIYHVHHPCLLFSYVNIKMQTIYIKDTT